MQKTNNPSNRKHRNEAYLLERRNEHSGVEGEGCREDSLKAYLTLPLLHIVFLHSEIDTIKWRNSISVHQIPQNPFAKSILSHADDLISPSRYRIRYQVNNTQTSTALEKVVRSTNQSIVPTSLPRGDTKGSAQCGMHACCLRRLIFTDQRVHPADDICTCAPEEKYQHQRPPPSWYHTDEYATPCLYINRTLPIITTPNHSAGQTTLVSTARRIASSSS